MALGLGFGFTRGSSGLSTTSDWSTWNGSQDTTAASMFSPIRGQMSSEPLDDTRLLAVYAYGNPTFSLRASIVTALGVVTNEVTLDGSNNFYGYPALVKLSDTRYLVVATVYNTRTDVFLLNVSGDTITVVDTSSYTATPMRQPFCNSIAVHSPSLVIAPFTSIATNGVDLMSISIAGDVLTINGVTTLWANGIVNGGKAITAMSATTGILIQANLINLYTITGTTPALTDTERLESGDSDTTDKGRLGARGLTDTTALVTWSDRTPKDKKVRVITNTGGTLSSGASTTLFTDDSFGLTGNDFIVNLKDNYYGLATEIGTQDFGVVVFSESSGALTKVNQSIIHATGDHPMMQIFEGGDIAMFTMQSNLPTSFSNIYSLLKSYT